MRINTQYQTSICKSCDSAGKELPSMKDKNAESRNTRKKKNIFEEENLLIPGVAVIKFNLKVRVVDKSKTWTLDIPCSILEIQILLSQYIELKLERTINYSRKYVHTKRAF